MEALGCAGGEAMVWRHPLATGSLEHGEFSLVLHCRIPCALAQNPSYA